MVPKCIKNLTSLNQQSNRFEMLMISIVVQCIGIELLIIA